jgi:hypothetical protein
MKRLVFLLISLCVLFVSCEKTDPALKDLVINKKNVNRCLEKARNGYINGEQMANNFSRLALEHLLVYQEHEKAKLYGDDENQYIFDRAMILLIMHEFVDSFELFRDYIEKTGDEGNVYFHVVKAINLLDWLSASQLADYVVQEVAGGRFKPNSLQHIALIDFTYTGYITVLRKSDDFEEIKKSKEYQENLKIWETGYNKVFIPEEKEYFIKELVAPQEFPADMISEIEQKSVKTSYELDFLVAYYLSTYNQDFQKAAHWADQRNRYVEQNNPELPISRIRNLMKAYIGVDRYDEALDVFTVNKTKIDALKMSQSQFNFLQAVCYAGKGDLESAKKYLKEEIRITEIREYSRKRGGSIPLTGDMLISLFEFYFIYDEFDMFWDSGKYNEIRDVFSEGLDRYRDLDVFNKVR